MKKQKKPTNPKLGFFFSIADLQSRLLGIQKVSPLFTFVLTIPLKRIQKDFEEFVVNKRNVKELSYQESQKLLKNLKEGSYLSGSLKSISRSLLITVVIEFDKFLSSLIKTIYLVKPEIINSSEAKYTLDQLLSFSSFDDARKFFVDDEVEKIMRKSHSDQFEWLEKVLKVNLRDNLSEWSDIIEITERRNLFVHCDGQVSKQYLRVTELNGKDVKKVKLNDVLDVDTEYLVNAIDNLLSASLKITAVVWAKFCSGEEISDAVATINNKLVELLIEGKYQLVACVSNYILTNIKDVRSSTRLTLVINYALAYKMMGKEKKCIEIVNQEDWTSASSKYLLARAVLLKKYDDAARHMRATSVDDVSPHNYKTWPLMDEFRETPQFLEAYQLVFNEKFVPITSGTERIIQLKEEIQKLDQS